MGVSEQEHKINDSSDHGGISVSEKKRLQSLKEKKEAFRAKEQAVQNALRNFDNNPRKNKIIFDDNVDDVPSPKVRKREGSKNKNNKQERRKKDLFDNDEDGEDDEIQPNWDCDEYQRKASVKALTSKYAFGNDERFKLDERFLDDNEQEQSEPVKEGDEADLEKEKEWQLKLLGSVLGVPVAPKNKEAYNSKKSMIRYDPSQKDHQTYEITQEQEEPTIKTKKKKREKVLNATQEEDNPVEVSKDIYFSVSENLTKSFKEEGQFSLLKTFGKEELEEKSEMQKSIPYDVKPNKITKSKFNFDTKNPFKYDSSDGENEDEESPNKISKSNNGLSEKESHLPSTTDRFFFGANDPRFDEAVKFFSKEALPTEEFINIRRELKQIVRAKIRHNDKKSQPWGGKKKILNRPKQASR